MGNELIKPTNAIERLKNGSPVVMVAFGDSITEGYMVGRGYVSFWRAAMFKAFPNADLRIINAGLSGDTTFDAVDRLRRDVIAYSPHFVSVQFGINDCFSTVYRGEFRENLHWIIHRIREETNAEIALFTSVLPRNQNDQDALLRYYDIVRQFAADCKTSLVELDTVWRKALRNDKDFDTLMLSDGIHPSEKGYRLIADTFLNLFL